MEMNFDRVQYYESDLQETPYDFDSIMHYSRTTFSSNGDDTLQSKFDPNKKLGNTKLSPLDIQKVNTFYQCHGKDITL